MRFPVAYWSAWDADAAFDPNTSPISPDEPAPWAVLTFVFHEGKVVLADITGRGYCIPSGKIEAGETPVEAAVRETLEETGARLRAPGPQPIGCYLLTPRCGSEAGKSRRCPVFVAEAAEFGPIPEGSESRGVLLAAMEDVPNLYFFWDDLLAVVFAYACEQHRRPRSESAPA